MMINNDSPLFIKYSYFSSFITRVSPSQLVMLKLLGDEMVRMQVWFVCFLQAFKTSPSSYTAASKSSSSSSSNGGAKVNGGTHDMDTGDHVTANGNGSLRKRKGWKIYQIK